MRKIVRASERSCEPAQPAKSAPGLYATAGSQNVGELDELSPTLKIGSDSSASVPAVIVDNAVYWETRIARNGRGGGMETVSSSLKAQSGSTGTGDAAPMVVYNITPVWGGGADLQATPAQVANAVTVTDHVKKTDRGLRILAPAPQNAQALDGKDVRLNDQTGSLTASMDSARVSNKRVGMVTYDQPCVSGDITHTLKAEGFDGSEDGTGRGMPIVPEYKDPVDCVTANSVQHYDVKSAQAGHLLSATTAVRRLTPTECERLQGFPDGWTIVAPTPKKKAK